MAGVTVYNVEEEEELELLLPLSLALPAPVPEGAGGEETSGQRWPGERTLVGLQRIGVQ